MRRWRRSCGEKSGTPAARQALAIAVRSASAPDPANRRVGVAVLDDRAQGSPGRRRSSTIARVCNGLRTVLGA
jgi:hypothetical protein